MVSDPQSALIGARLRMAREAAGVSRGTLARRSDYSVAAIGHFETGRRRPPPAVIALYESQFGSVASESVTSLTALGRGDVDRRSFLRRAAYSATLSATALTLPGEASRRIATITDSSIVGIGEVDALRTVTDAFCRFDERRGGGTGRTAIAEFLATDVATLLRSRFSTTAVRAQAYSAAAELTYLAGFKAHDASLHGLAQRYYLTARDLAEASGVPGHDAWIYRILALEGADLGERGFCVDLAEEAVRRAHGRVEPATEAVFVIALARCYAETGRRAEALATLRRAQHGMNSPAGHTPAWCAWWCGDQATTHNQAAKTYRALGEWGDAEAHHLQAASYWQPGLHRRVYSRTMADVGLARWYRGDHSGAVDAWKIAVPTLLSLTSIRAAAVLAKIGKRAPELLTA